jgi:hypothetical protein
MAQDTTTTRLFSSFDPNARGNEDFIIDLRRLLSLWADDAKRSVFRAQCPAAFLTRTNREQELLLEGLSREVNEPFKTVKSAFDCASFFVRRLARGDGVTDEPGSLAHDLERLRLVDDSQVATVTDLFRWLKNDFVVGVEGELRRRSAAAGLVPSLKGIATEVELRAIQKDAYESTQSVDNYKPTILGVVPVATVEIRTTDQDPYIFQAEKAELQIILSYIKAALKDLDALERYRLGEQAASQNEC